MNSGGTSPRTDHAFTHYAACGAVVTALVLTRPNRMPMTSVFFAPPTWSTIILIVACATATGVALWQARRWPLLFLVGTVLCAASLIITARTDPTSWNRSLINVSMETGRLVLLIAVLTALTALPTRTALSSALAAMGIIGYAFGLHPLSPDGGDDLNDQAIAGILAALMGTGAALVGTVRRPSVPLSHRRVWTTMALLVTPMLAGVLAGISPQPGSNPRHIMIIIAGLVIGVGVVLGIVLAGRSMIRPAAMALLFAGTATPLAISIQPEQFNGTGLNALLTSLIHSMMAVLGLFVGLGLLFIPWRAAIATSAISMLGIGVLFGHTLIADDPYQLHRRFPGLLAAPILMVVTATLVVGVGAVFLTNKDQREAAPAAYTALLTTLYHGITLADQPVPPEPGSPLTLFPGGTLLTSGIMLLTGAALLLVAHMDDASRGENLESTTPVQPREPGPAPFTPTSAAS